MRHEMEARAMLRVYMIPRGAENRMKVSIEGLRVEDLGFRGSCLEN